MIKSGPYLNNSTTRLLIYGFGLFLFCYTLIRAYLLSFTWDEAYTYLEFVRRPFWLPHEFNTMAANNHLLNTWLMKICASLFGISEFSLRLPNLFAHLLYLFFSMRLVRSISNNTIMLLAFVLLNFNPYILDFFSAARGYGLSMGFMMGSLYFVSSFFNEERKFTSALFAILFSILALLANLTLFPFFLVISTTLIIFLFIHLIRKRYTVKAFGQIFVLLLICSLSIYFILPYSLKLKACGALFFGGENNFFSDTLVSLFWEVLYERPHFFPIAISLAATALLILLFSIRLSFRLISMKEFKKEISFFIVLTGITFFCLSAPLLQHYFMGTKFPTQRTGLFLLPLFSLLFIFLLQRVKETNAMTKFSLFAGLMISMNFIASINFHSLLNWSEDASVKEAMNFFAEDHKTVFTDRFNVTIGTEMMYGPCINYYRVKNNLTWLNPADCREPNEYCDYYFTYRSRARKLKDAKAIKIFYDTLMLLKNERKTRDHILVEQKLKFDDTIEEKINSKAVTNKYYYSGKYAAYTDSSWSYSKGFDFVFADTMVNKKVIVCASAMLFAPENNFDGRFVISFEHADGILYSWQFMDVRDVLTVSNQWKKISYSRFSSQELKAGDHLKVYLWNFGVSPLCIDDLDVKIIGY